ncbi:unnamed protein product [Blepharisma stoltei]|uniref:Cyclic nucleotide-binding domain-containing protein n=1 Tax=Blepharisma stoltei TaxID=1481888 RepID=A0AAU9J2W2_9CILI|nr:unnamed protein product [Blepharisma stoltei]
MLTTKSKLRHRIYSSRLSPTYSQISTTITNTRSVSPCNYQYLSPQKNLKAKESKAPSSDENSAQKLPSLSSSILLCPKEISAEEMDEWEDEKFNDKFLSAINLRKKGNFFEAAKVYIKILTNSGQNASVSINLGVCFLKLGLITEAIGAFDQAIKANSGLFIAYFNKALSQIYIQQYADAIECMNIALRNINGSPPSEFFKVRALALYRSGKISEALEAIKNQEIFETLEICKGNGSVKKHNIVDLEWKLKEYRETEIVFDKKKRKPNLVFLSNEIKEFDTRTVNARAVTPRLLKRRESIKKSNYLDSTRCKTPTYNNKQRRISLASTKPTNISVQSPTPILHTLEDSRETTESPSFYIQEDLSPAQVKENILKSFDVHKKINEKLQTIKAKIDEDIAKQEIFFNKEGEGLETSLLTQQDLLFIHLEFKKDKTRRNYEKIDTATKKLSFFQKFSKEVRISLLKIANFVEFRPGEIVFRQGDSGDMMYVILNGSISIEKKSSEFGNKEIVVNSLYDGKQFGELALISALRPGDYSSKRMATCVCSEISKMLQISKVEYNKIILTQLRADIEKKLSFLERLPLFAGLDPALLIPIASDVEITSYDFDEVVLDKGDPPKGLYLVMSGHAIAFTEGYKIVGKKVSEFAPKLKKPSPKPFYTGNIEPPCDEAPHSLKITLDEGPIFRALNRVKDEATEDTWKKIEKFVSKEELSSIGKNKFIVKERIPHLTVQKNDYFGGRAILEGDVIENQDHLKTIEVNRYEISASKFSIIAQSPMEIMIITKYHVNYLNEKVVNQMKSILKRGIEQDSPNDVDPYVMDKLFIKWQDFKEEIVEDIRRISFLNRKKDPAAFLRL